MKYKTEQEHFWSGEFGDNYIKRNKNLKIISSNIALFSKILSRVNKVESVLEFGANIGLNLKAIQKLIPNADFSAIEINEKAVYELNNHQWISNVYHQSLLDFNVDYQRDFVFIKTVLIHINPEYLSNVYELLYQSSKKYICIAEYYNPSPTEIEYRGHTEKLFKRDFAGDIMKKYNDLKLIDYGFVYHGDPNFPQDDITWFLLEKTE